jgi:hypothetical protein
MNNKQPNDNETSNHAFFEIVEFSLPRILGLCDRNAESPTYGCFDRNYWHYKLIDFPNIRFQEAVSLLALLYNYNILDPFYRNKKIRSLVAGAVNFAFSKQNSDGSFNEVYPFERSFCGTSFAGNALVESILLLGLKGWTNSLMKLGNWLSKHNNPEVSNQMAAAANTLYLLSLVTQEKKYREASYHKVALLREQRGNERFLPEYGGLDIGYLSITLSHLAMLWKHSKNKEVYQIAIDAAELIEKTIDEYGRFDWTNMSRKTQFIYPYGFAVFEKVSVLKKLEHGLKKNLILNPTWMDDRYCIAFTLNYLKAVVELSHNYKDFS